MDLSSGGASCRWPAVRTYFAPFLRGEDRKLRDIRKGTMLVLIFGLVILAVGIRAMLSTSKELRIRRQIAESGAVAEARIVVHKVSFEVGVRCGMISQKEGR